MLDKIKQFRAEFKSRPGWEKGSPKRANNVTQYHEEEKKKAQSEAGNGNKGPTIGRPIDKAMMG